MSCLVDNMFRGKNSPLAPEKAIKAITKEEQLETPDAEQARLANKNYVSEAPLAAVPRLSLRDE